MTEHNIEFDKVKITWAAFAVTQKAKEQIENAEIILEESHLLLAASNMIIRLLIMMRL